MVDLLESALMRLLTEPEVNLTGEPDVDGGSDLSSKCYLGIMSYYCSWNYGTYSWLFDVKLQYFGILNKPCDLLFWYVIQVSLRYTAEIYCMFAASLGRSFYVFHVCRMFCRIISKTKLPLTLFD